MHLSERQTEILHRARALGRVEVEALAAEFAVTTQTIRRDLNELSQGGLIARVHGGAVVERAGGQRRLCRAAGGFGAGEAADRRALRGDDPGRLLGDPQHRHDDRGGGAGAGRAPRPGGDHQQPQRRLDPLGDARARTSSSTGGIVRQSDGAIVGDEAVEFIRKFKADFAVIGCSALDEDGAIMDYDLREVAVARAIVENARRTILVCDRLKFERTAPIRICSAADIHAFVTDAPPPPAFAEACARAGVAIEIAGGRGGVSDGAGVDLLVIGGGVNGCAHRPRRGRARAVGAAGRAGRPGAGDLVGLDQAVPRRPALSRVLRVPAGARVADRARDAAPGDAAHLVAAALRAAAPCRACGRPGCCGSGCSIYDHLGGRKILPPTRTLDLARDPAGVPLRPAYRRGFEYSDCWVDDARLVVLLARDAAARGRGDPDADPLRAGGAARATAGGCRARTGRRAEVAARAVVNAAGPWVGEVVRDGLRRRSAPARGAAGARQPHRHAAAVRARPRLHLPAAGRAHRLRHPLRGRLHADRHHRRRARGRAGRGGLHARGARLPARRGRRATSATPVAVEDIVWSYSGVRPLYDDGASSATAATRDYVLEVGDEGGKAPVLNVFGGKITTHRRLAEAAMAKLAPCVPGDAGRLDRRGAAAGRRLPWDGAAALGGGLRARASVPRRRAGRRGWCGSTAPRRRRCSRGRGRRRTSASDFGAGPDRARAALAAGARVGADGRGRALAAHQARAAARAGRRRRGSRPSWRRGVLRRPFTREECRKRVGNHSTSPAEAPEAGLGELDRVAGRVADVDRAGAEPGQRKSASIATPAASSRARQRSSS